jgi:hypothetical protein
MTCSGLMISTSCGVWMSAAVTGPSPSLRSTQRDFVAVVQRNTTPLRFSMMCDHVFLHAVDRRVLVQHAGDRDLGRRVADHRRQQHAAQRVAQGVAVAALEGLERDLGALTAERLDVDGFGFQQIGLHESCSSQYPRLVTPIRLMDHAAGKVKPARGTGAAAGSKRHAGAAPPPQRSARVQLDDQRFVDVGTELVAVRHLLEDAFQLVASTSPRRAGRPTRPASGVQDAQLLLGLFAHGDHVAGLDQVGRDVDRPGRSP